MSVHDPRAQPLPHSESETPLPWSTAREALDAARKYWVTTVDADGRPAIAPVMAAFLDDVLYYSARGASRKARNLAANPHVAISVDASPLELVVEGEAARVTDTLTLERIAERYRATQGWPVVPVDGAYDAPFGMGDPPYNLYSVTPTTAYGFWTADGFNATRWRFGH